MNKLGNHGRLGLALLVLALSGCASSPSHPPTQIIGIDDDPAADEVQFNGAEWFLKGFGGSHLWLIRSSVDRGTGAQRHHLYVELQYRGRLRHFEMARDAAGRPLKAYTLDQRVYDCGSFRGCHVQESLAITLDDAMLRAMSREGARVHVLARGGFDLPIQVRDDQARLQLGAIRHFLEQQDVADTAADAEATVAGSAVTAQSNPVPVEANPTLGAALADLSPDQARARLRRGLKAVVILDVSPGSVAKDASLQTGDILYEFDGKPVGSIQDLHAAVASTLIGREVPLRVVRGLQDLNLTAQF